MAHSMKDSLVAELKDESGKVCAVFKFDSQNDLEAFGNAVNDHSGRMIHFRVTCLRLFVGNTVIAVRGDL